MAVIEFLCPNGHKIRCQADQAGRPAKCVRCGVKFRVPDAAELAASRSDALSRPDLDDLGFSVANEKPPASPPPMAPRKEEQMEFLCPNGHRLFGSTSLAGRPGECPDCGARFRIPSYEEAALENHQEQEDDEYRISMPADGPGNVPTMQHTMPMQPMASQAAASSPPMAPSPQMPPMSPMPQSPPMGAGRQPPHPGSGLGPGAGPGRDAAERAWEEEVMPATVWSVAAGTALGDQPVATLFARLWTTRPKGTHVELVLRDGETIVVEQFVASLSQTSHGVFGVKAQDNTFTLMAIAWDTIARVMVRGLSELPH
jgi:hypothetical protein